MTAADRALLRQLAEEIPVLEERLRAMKITRRNLRASETMTAKRKDPAFNARVMAATARRNASPEGQARWAKARNDGERLPWPKGTRERARYRSLLRKKWTRELAIAKVRAEFPDYIALGGGRILVHGVEFQDG